MAGTLTIDDQQREGPWDELIGRPAGSFRIVRLLGKGGMGAVYLARHPGIGSQVAVKFLHPRLVGDRHHVERFFNEARAVNVIGHENIVKTLDFNVTPEGRYYFVMEYLTGRPLSSLLTEKKPVPLSVAGPILLQCCKALQAAHERQITHRDLKPDNIFLTSQMGKKHFVKLVDFGIAKLSDGAEGRAQTEAGVLIGTPEYMSPEQASGRSSEVGRRSDVYSLGVVMYQLATGQVPFSAPSTAETLVAHLQQPPAPPRSIEPSVPASYEAVILRALAKRREDRFQTMGELHDAILAALHEQGLSGELPPADAEPEPQPAPQQAAETGSGTTAVSARPVLTGTFAGDRAPLQARADRAADWALAPARRGRTLGAAVAVLALLVWWSWPSPRRAEPAPVAVARTEPGAPAQPAAKPAPKPAATTPDQPAGVPAAAAQKPSATQQKPAAAGQKPRKQPAPAAAPPPGPMTAADAARAAGPDAREHQLFLRARAELAAAAEAAARADLAQPTPPGGVKLFIASEPLGASVTAAWNGKSAAGQTPFVFRVRRGAAVTLTFARPGFAAVVRELTASAAQVVSVELRPER